MIGETDDTQRRLERQALRNVRGLVDKLEAGDRMSDAAAVRSLLTVFAVIVVGIGTLACVNWIFFPPRVFRIESSFALPPSPSNAVSSPRPAPRLRRDFVASASKGTPLGGYIDAWARKIEFAGSSNFPLALRRKQGRVQLTTAIRADGTLESVEVNKSSGDAAFDAAAVDVVKSAAPFSAFPESMSKDMDVLHITRTLYFGRPPDW